MHRVSEGNHCQTNEHRERHRDVDITDAKNPVSKGIHNIDQRVDLRYTRPKIGKKIERIKNASEVCQRGQNEGRYDVDVVERIGKYSIDKPT